MLANDGKMLNSRLWVGTTIFKDGDIVTVMPYVFTFTVAMG